MPCHDPNESALWERTWERIYFDISFLDNTICRACGGHLFDGSRNSIESDVARRTRCLLTVGISVHQNIHDIFK